MANGQDSSEKTEQPSPFKLKEAKKKGSVAKSMEANSLFALGAACLVLVGAGSVLIEQSLQLCRDLFLQAGQASFQPREFLDWSSDFVFSGLAIIAPFAAVFLIVGVLATLLQTGPVFSFFPLKPDMKRINPVQGFKRIFSMKMLFEAVKSLIKLAAFSVLVYFTIDGLIPKLLKLPTVPVNTYPQMFIGDTASFLFKCLVLLAFVALIDLLFTRFDYTKQMRMSKHEVKEEVKKREGDPLIRSKRRELQQELRQRSQSLQSVSDADVIITNPTRFAVLLKYDRNTMQAPQVIGKGSGEMAQLIKDRARIYHVPVVRKPALARLLFRRCHVSSFVPYSCFVDVAKVYREVREKQRISASGALQERYL